MIAVIMLIAKMIHERFPSLDNVITIMGSCNTPTQMYGDVLDSFTNEATFFNMLSSFLCLSVSVLASKQYAKQKHPGRKMCEANQKQHY